MGVGGGWWFTTPEAAPAIQQADAYDDSVYYNSCREAREAGAAPLSRGEPGYRPGLDADGDGEACEPYFNDRRFRRWRW